MKIERRMAVENVEVRAADGEPTRIVGYGALFNTEAIIGGRFRERIMPGAFAPLLKTDVRSLFNHDPNYVLGRTTSGTLTMVEDEKGLRYDVVPPSTRQDVVESMQRGDITGSSFGFAVADGGDEWTRGTRSGELPLRTIHRFAELLDVGPVTYPAYEETTAEARSQADALATAAGTLARAVDVPDMGQTILRQKRQGIIEGTL